MDNLKLRKKNIIIKNGCLTMGGGEVVLINFIKVLDLNAYNVKLLIDDDHGEKNVFINDIPKEIDVFFLRPKLLVEKLLNLYKRKKKNIFEKLNYNYLLWKNTQESEKRCLSIVNNIRKKDGEIDIFIDFNGGSRKYIDRIKAKRKIIWRHISLVEYTKESKLKRYGKYADKYDLVTVVCNNMKNEFLDKLSFLSSKIVVVYNSFNFEEIERLSDENNCINNEEKRLIKKEYITTISRLDMGKKDYDTLILGYKIAKAKGLKYKLYIIGDGPGRRHIEEIIKINNLTNDIILLGEKKNPYVWIKNSQFFVLSSKEEGFGMVIVEALYFNKAVISSNCPIGPSELLNDGEFGILFPVGDYEYLAEKLLFLQDKGNRIQYEKKSRERALNFDIKKIKSQYNKLIN